MTAMANITVKKADGTTDIVWAGLSPSAGDKVPAIWRSQTVGASVAFRPEFKLTTSSPPNGNQRSSKATMVYPVVETIAGKSSVLGYITFSGEFKVLNLAPDVDAGEAVYQCMNLLGSSLIKQSVKEGFAPT